MKISKLIISSYTRQWLIKSLPMALLAVLILSACEDPKEIGGNLIETQLSTTYVDTFTVNLSTVLLDSNETANSNTLLVGAFDDPYFGKVNGATYFEMAVADTNQLVDGEINREYVFDSVRFEATYNYFYGDTNRLVTLRIHELTDTLAASVTPFSNSATPKVSGAVAEFRFRPRPTLLAKPTTGTDTNLVRQFGTLALKLDQSSRTLGSKFIAFTRNRKSFGNYHGLALTSIINDNSVMLGFNPASANIVSYYRYKSKVGNVVTGRDTILSGNYKIGLRFIDRLNQVNLQKTGVLTQLRKPGDLIQSKNANGDAFLHPITGMALKIDLPYITEFRKKGGQFAINRAELILEPKANTVTDLTPPPPSVGVYSCTPKNQLIRNKVKTNSVETEVLSSIQLDDRTGAVANALYNSDKKQYSINLTRFLQTYLSNFSKIDFNGFLVTTPYSSANIPGANGVDQGTTTFISHTTINRAVLNGRTAKLKIYYTAAK
jgi:hypothetical protein